MELRRIADLPPYSFAIVEKSKAEAAALGLEVFDFGFGNPDLPSPPLAVNELRSSVLDPSSHRYSISRGISDLRQAFAQRYLNRWGVCLDPESEVVATMGTKEGLTHLTWLLLSTGDRAFVPDPSYPIHSFAPRLAGAETIPVPISCDDDGGEDFLRSLDKAYQACTRKPRVLIVSFPHNPTTLTVSLEFMEELVSWALATGVFIVHDFAYSDTYFGEQPPSILQVSRAKEVAVEAVTLTKSFSMAGWRIGAVAGNAEVLAALVRLKSYIDYGSFKPIQLAAASTLVHGGAYVDKLNNEYRLRRDTLVEGLNSHGWPTTSPKGTMFVWTRIPSRFRMDSGTFASYLATTTGVVVSPGAAFGTNGEGWVRFALIMDTPRIEGALRALKDI